MNHEEETKLNESVNQIKTDVAVIKEQISQMPCRKGIGFKCWSIQSKAVAGSGAAGLIAAILLAVYDLLSRGH